MECTIYLLSDDMQFRYIGVRDAKTLQTYKPGLEEGFGQKLRKVLLSKIKFYIVGILLTSVENKSSINT